MLNLPRRGQKQEKTPPQIIFNSPRSSIKPGSATDPNFLESNLINYTEYTTTGCPAAYGNKFINNKLVRIVENMNRLPCYADLNNKLFPPNHYHITYDNILYQKDILTA